MSSGSNVWHEYRDGMTLCGGKWFPTGSSPCELADLDLADDLNDNIPECEASDEDILALKELLGQPRVGFCRAQGRASWFKPDPDKTLSISNFSKALAVLGKADLDAWVSTLEGDE